MTTKAAIEAAVAALCDAKNSIGHTRYVEKRIDKALALLRAIPYRVPDCAAVTCPDGHAPNCPNATQEEHLAATGRLAQECEKELNLRRCGVTTQKERFDELIEPYKTENLVSPETAIRAFLSVLDRAEETDSGRVFHPTTIWSCRVVETAKIEVLLDYFRSLDTEY